MRLLNIITLCCAALLSACSAPEPVKQADKPYYDLNEQLLNNLNMVLAQKPSLEKEASLGTETDSHNWQPDSAEWQLEFTLLFAADINKRNLLQAYSTTELTGKSGELTGKKYTRTDGENNGVQEMTVYYKENPADVRKVEVMIQEKNSLYHSIKNLNIFFEPSEGAFSLLNKYTINGGQKMLLRDTLVYEVQGKIIY